MAGQKDIRWQQRFSNYRKALARLSEAVSREELNRLEEQGLIQGFEYTFELAWNTIKDFYQFQGEEAIQGSRDAFRMAINRGLVNDGHTWMDMIKSRQDTVHSYNEETAREVARDVREKYYPLFVVLEERMLEEMKEDV